MQSSQPVVCVSENLKCYWRIRHNLKCCWRIRQPEVLQETKTQPEVLQRPRHQLKAQIRGSSPLVTWRRGLEKEEVLTLILKTALVDRTENKSKLLNTYCLEMVRELRPSSSLQTNL